MRSWALLLGGLGVWAAHFFVLYGIASILPGQAGARWLVAAATLPALAADALILRAALRSKPGADALDGWIAQVAAAGAAISLIAVVWQAAPALLA